MIENEEVETPDQFYKDQYHTMKQAVFALLIIGYILIKQPLEPEYVDNALLIIKLYAIILLLNSLVVNWRGRYFTKDSK